MSDSNLESAKISGPMQAVAASEFSLVTAVGGLRGFIESIAPGLVFVIAFVVTRDWPWPVGLAVAVTAILVVVRLAQKQPWDTAASGVVGVALGALWAWRAGEASEYFVPGFWITGAYVLGLAVSMAVRWPAVGILVGYLRGWGTSWRASPRHMRLFQITTAIFLFSQALKLIVQLPLYYADQVTALGTARLVMGAPLLALVAWLIWWLVRGLTAPAIALDQPQGQA